MIKANLSHPDRFPSGHLTRMDLQTSFVSNLRRELQDRGWSQSDLAKLMDVNPSHISQLFSGYRKPGLKTIEMTAEALGINALELLLPHNCSPELRDSLRASLRSNRPRS